MYVALDPVCVERVDEHLERAALRGQVGAHVRGGGLRVASGEPVDAPLQEDAERDGRVVVCLRVVVEPVHERPCEQVQQERRNDDEREAEEHQEVHRAAAEQNAVYQRRLTCDARYRRKQRPRLPGGHNPVEGPSIEKVAKSALLRSENTSTRLELGRAMKITTN